jgi:cell division transport system permease protein
MAKNGREKSTRNLRNRLRSSYLTTVISISLVLFLTGLTGLLVLNANRFTNYIKENIGFSIILNQNIKEIDILRLQKDLDASQFVKSTEYITSDRAAKEFQEEIGEDFVDFLGYNPLLASIEVKLYAGYANQDSISVIENYLMQYPQIKEVYYERNLINLVNENVRKISSYLLFFSGLLLLISVVLINNTIRLSVYSRRFTINTMKLIGATRGFIRRPFLLTGILQGLLGGVIAILLLIFLIDLMQKEFHDIIRLTDIKVMFPLFAGILFAGFIITLTAAFFAVTRFLKMKPDELYY